MREKLSYFNFYLLKWITVCLGTGVGFCVELSRLRLPDSLTVGYYGLWNYLCRHGRVLPYYSEIKFLISILFFNKRQLASIREKYYYLFS